MFACMKFVGGRGSAPDPAGGAYDAPPDPLVGLRRLRRRICGYAADRRLRRRLPASRSISEVVRGSEKMDSQSIINIGSLFCRSSKNTLGLNKHSTGPHRPTGPHRTQPGPTESPPDPTESHRTLYKTSKHIFEIDLKFFTGFASLFLPKLHSAIWAILQLMAFKVTNYHVKSIFCMSCEVRLRFR